MAFRIVARLDVKPPNLVKGVHLEGLRKLGDPAEFARAYYDQGIDEIIYQDIVASLYERNSITDLVSLSATNVFVPMTVGGGIRETHDATALVRAGADKVCLNTGAVRRPQLITDIAAILGSQAVVVGIEAKRFGESWRAMTDCGREHTGRDVIEWAREAQDSGAGELLLTSIDQEGTMRGPDLKLVETVRSVVRIPIVAHGGVRGPEDALRLVEVGASAVAIAACLHSGAASVADFKTFLRDHGVEVRP